MKRRAKRRTPPQRSCAGCRTVRDKGELVRIVRTPEGKVVLDDGTGKLPGRGAYVCPDETCLKRALRTKAFERALKTALPAEVADALQERIAGSARSRTAASGDEAGAGANAVSDREG